MTKRKRKGKSKTKTIVRNSFFTGLFIFLILSLTFLFAALPKAQQTAFEDKAEEMGLDVSKASEEEIKQELDSIQKIELGLEVTSEVFRVVNAGFESKVGRILVTISKWFTILLVALGFLWAILAFRKG